MKKRYSTAVLVASSLVLLGCPVTDPEEPAAPDPEVTNNLSASQGENELVGIYTDNSVRYEFKADRTVTQSVATTASRSYRAASDWTETATYYYSWNTTQKTVEFQLAALFESGSQTDYQSQLANAKEKYGGVREALITALQADSFASAGADAIENGSNLIQAYVTSKAASYVDKQQEALVQYLAAKYNSVITLGYELKDNTLTLTQKYSGTITDASSRFSFTGTEYGITLNDWEQFIPLGVTVGNKQYVGIPNVDADKKTITADLYEGLGDVLTEGSSAVTTIVSAKTTEVTQALADISDDWKKIAAELLLNSNESKTLDSHLEGVLTHSTLSASYDVSTENGTILTLTPTDVPSALASVITKGTGITLSYEPIISTAALTKQQ